MLKTIDPVLSADLLWVLAAMGPGGCFLLRKGVIAGPAPTAS